MYCGMVDEGGMYCGMVDEGGCIVVWWTKADVLWYGVRVSSAQRINSKSK
jgi:hypothetical protein